MQVVTVEDREAEADQRHFKRLAQVQGVALDELAVTVADQEVGLLGEAQAAHVPQVGAGVGLAVDAVGRLGQHLLHRLVPLLAAVVAQHMDRLGAQFQQELAHAHDEVRIAVQRELLAVQPGVAVGHHVHQAAAFFRQAGGNRLAGHFGHLHQPLVGPLQAHRNVQLGHFVGPGGFDQFLGLFQLHRLQQEGGDGVRRILHFGLAGAAGIHAEFAVGRGVEHFGRVGQQVMFDTHFVQHAVNDAEVAQVGLEAGHQVDLAVAADFLVRHVVQREVAGDAFEHVVPAGDMAADERRGVGVGNRVVLRDMTGVLGVVDEGIEVVTDDFRHTGGGDRDHFRLVQRQRILQAVEHVLLAAEHRRVFGHRVGHAGDRLLEVAIEVGAEVGDATLRTMHIGQGLFKAQRAQHGAEGLAGLGRVDGQRFALEVEFLVFHRGGPLEGFRQFGFVDALFEQLLLVVQHVLVIVIAEQRVGRLDVFNDLHVHLLARAANLRTRA